MQKNKILITCAKGIPPFLKQELLALSFPVLSEAIAGFETEGTIDDTLRLNLHLRTARGATRGAVPPRIRKKNDSRIPLPFP